MPNFAEMDPSVWLLPQSQKCKLYICYAYPGSYFDSYTDSYSESYSVSFSSKKLLLFHSLIQLQCEKDVPQYTELILFITL